MRDWYGTLVSSLLFPLHERLKGHSTLSERRRLERSQWWSTEEIEHYRTTGLRRFLEYAGRHVPYYRDLFARIGFSPAEVETLRDLQRLPLLTKPQIRANSDAMRSERARGLTRFNTGGSSGEPLIFWMGRDRISHDVAAKWRATRWWGVDIGDPEVVIWGSPLELNAQDRVRGVRDRLLRTTLLPAFEMSETKLDCFLEIIRERRPKMLFGYPSALAHLAGHAEKRGAGVRDIGIKVALVTSERLYPHQRERIERVFGCSVADGYGGRDAGFIAHECPDGGMHISAEDIIVEIVDPEGRVLPPGESGEIVVTHLATRDFPFLRYRTGDIGVLDDRRCACGRGLPLLKQIQGRATDFVVARDGTVMHGLALIYVVRDVPGIKEFKIIQESLDQTRLQLVTESDFPQSALVPIERGFKERLGEQVQVEIECLDSIPREASGKFRYVVSNVAAH